MASSHLSGMEYVLQMWRLSVNVLYQPTCAGEKLCSRNLEFDQCLKILAIKKHPDTECYMELLICTGPCEYGNAPYLCLIRGGYFPYRLSNIPLIRKNFITSNLTSTELLDTSFIHKIMVLKILGLKIEICIEIGKCPAK